ncbi:MAG: hypothetical protein ACLUEK_09300 [Oscillospiraceae bacterium]
MQWLKDFLAGFGITIDALEDFSVDWDKVFSDLTTSSRRAPPTSKRRRPAPVHRW